MAALAPAKRPAPRPRRTPPPGSVFGLRAAQVAAWVPAGVGLGYGLGHPGTPAGAALTAGAGVVLAGTMLRLGHRWMYQWAGAVLLTRHRPVSTRLVLPGEPGIAGLRRTLLPELRIRPAGPANARIGVIEDGSSWTVVVALEPEHAGAELPPALLAPALYGDDVTLAAVQVLVHTVPAPRRGLPRTELIRVALRLDPRTAGPGSERLGVPSFQRTLRMRARQVTELLAPYGWRGRVLTAEEAHAALLTGTALDAAGVPKGRQRWRSWRCGGRRHAVYWLRRWPAGGLPALQENLTRLRVDGTFLSVTLVPSRYGVTATALLRVISERRAAPAVRRLARASRTQLVPLGGEQHEGVLATLPLARETRSPIAWRPYHRIGPSAVLRAGGQGLVLGRGEHGLVTMPFFQGTPFRTALLSDSRLARVLALRAVGAGAYVRVVTSRPGLWSPLRKWLELVPPGTDPVEGTALGPWLVLDDATGAAGEPAPWCARADLLSEPSPGLLGDYPAVLLHRPATAAIDALDRAFGLPRSAAHGLRMMPRHAVALVRPGSVELVDLMPTAEESTLLNEDDRPG
jgi:type VII secretion protein EccE